VAQCKSVAQIDIETLNSVQFAKEFPKIPVIYLYSRKDEFVESSDSMEIFNKLSTDYKFFVDCNAKHNEFRKDDKIQKVFNLLKELRIKKDKRRKTLIKKKLRSNMEIGTIPTSHQFKKISQKGNQSNRRIKSRNKRNGSVYDRQRLRQKFNPDINKKRAQSIYTITTGAFQTPLIKSPLNDLAIKDLQKVSIHLNKGNKCLFLNSIEYNSKISTNSISEKNPDFGQSFFKNDATLSFIKVQKNKKIDRKELLINPKELHEKFKNLESEGREVNLPKTKKIHFLNASKTNDFDLEDSVSNSNVTQTKPAYQVMEANTTQWKNKNKLTRIETISKLYNFGIIKRKHITI
jgi:hypothetical protein